ncbi:MAG: DUF349 domain-containing protein [Lachnospiraceae bacterium]|nr:DUF349 domain-containing protein [Lachnospiraceae bacterium]
MSVYEKLPEFNDELAVKRERIHYPSGATVIEVLYGAKDAEGNPTTPGKESDDGHGLFSALVIDGTYRLLLWQHSTAEGGALEQGEHTLQELESNLKLKKSILDEARAAIDPSGEYDTTAVDAILARFPADLDMGTPKERELKTQFNGISDRNRKNRDRYASDKENASKKRGMIEKAVSLKDTQDWTAATEQMKALMEEWKRTGRAGADNDALWEEFSAAQKAFYDAKHVHFESQFGERIEKKKQIIEEAKKATAEVADWEATHQKLEAMLESWKAVGGAGREEDDKLWAAFQEVRNAFYEKRSEQRKERDAEFKARREAKRELIEEAQSYAKSCDYSKVAAERMRGINEEWKKIGSAGRRDEENLWKQLREAQDAYWEGKRSADAGKHRQWLDNTRDAVERRRARIVNIQANIEKLKERLETTGSDEKRAQIEGWIAENEEQITTLTAEADRMESELKKSEEKDAQDAARRAEEEAKAEAEKAAKAAEPAAQAAAVNAEASTVPAAVGAANMEAIVDASNAAGAEVSADEKKEAE